MEEKFGFGKTVLGMLKGLVRPKAYAETAKKTAWFNIHLLIIIVCIILPAALIMIPAFVMVGNDKIANEIDERAVYFALSEDGFYCEKTYEWSTTDASLIRIDTSAEGMQEDEIEELLAEGRYETMVIANSREILLYSDNEANVIEWESIYGDLKGVEDRDIYDKALIVNTIKKYDNPLIIVLYVIIVCLMLLIYYIAGMIWGLVGSVIKGIVKAENDISMSNIMKIAMMIRTPWVIIISVLIIAVFKGAVITSLLLGVLIELNYMILALYSLKDAKS